MISDRMRELVDEIVEYCGGDTWKLWDEDFKPADGGIYKGSLLQSIAALEASQLPPGMVAVRKGRLEGLARNPIGCVLLNTDTDCIEDCYKCRMAWLTEQPTDQQQPEGEEGGGRKI